MTYERRAPSEKSIYGSFFMKMNVVTNVVRNSPDNAKTSDTSRTQRTGNGNTYPTQMSTGTYTITNEAHTVVNNNSDNRFGKGEQGLFINFSQKLQGVDPATNEPIEGVTFLDEGYMIHITPNDYTDGCIGIKYDPNNKESRERAEGIMNHIVDQYNDAKKYGEKVIIVITE